MSGKMTGYSVMYRKKKKILNRKTFHLPGIVSFAVLCALMTFPAGYPVLAQESCVASECHTNMGKGKYLHGPIAANECKVCHIVGSDDRPPKNHDLSYNKEGKALCLDCHEKLEQFLQGKKIISRLKKESASSVMILTSRTANSCLRKQHWRRSASTATRTT